MARLYVHLSLEDRRKISRWHEAKMPALEIAARLGRHRATTHRELKRNRFVDAELQYLSGYYAMTAQSICERRRAGLRKFIRHRDLRGVVVHRMKTGWTPRQIAGHLRLEGSGLQVSHETIYQFAHSKDGHAIDLWHHLPEPLTDSDARFAMNPHVTEVVQMSDLVTTMTAMQSAASFPRLRRQGSGGFQPV